MNSTGCKLLLTACLMVAIPLMVLAQSGKITGVVKDASTQEAVVGANVVLEGTNYGAAADANGTYFILNVPPGSYRVTASAVGYAKKSIVNVSVGADQIVTVDFDLQSEAIGLGEVVVEAQQRVIDPSQTTAKTRITSDEVSALPIREVSDLLSISASVFKGFVRGGKQYETKTLVDGVDVTDQFYAASADQSLTPYTTYNGITHQRAASKSALVDMNSNSVQEANVQTGGVGADYSSATAGVISYSLKEGRGKLTGGATFKTSTGGLDHLGPDVYHDGERYTTERATLLSSGIPANVAKAALYTWSPGKYSYGKRPTVDFQANFGGSINEDLGLYLTAGTYQTYGAYPGEFFKRANGSLKATYNLNKDMRLNVLGMLEDRGRLFGWKNSNYVDMFRFFLEGVPKYDGYNMVGSAKLTHVLSPSTFYEVQVSYVTDNTRRGYVDANNDGVIKFNEKGDFLTFADTSQVNRYLASGSGTQMEKFFSPSPQNELGSETSFTIPSGGYWKIARPGIYYEDFTSSTITLKGDLTSQFTLHHQLRAGLQLRLLDFDKTLRASYIGGTFPAYKNYVEEIWNVKPKEFSAYVQDKMEYAGMIINIGARLDGLDLAAADYANFFGPFQDITDANGGPVRVPVRGEIPPMKFYFSPRLGVSHPISDVAAMYFSFSRETQSQPFSQLFTNYNDFGNPSLPVVARVNQDPIKSTNYDLGVQWSFAEGYGLDVNAYYRDIENYGRIGFQVTPRAPWRLYNLVTDFGYADSRGLEVTLRKSITPVTDWLSVGGRVSYAYSYIKQAVYAGGNSTTFSTVAGDSATYSGGLPFDDLKNYNTIERNVLGGNSSLTGGYDRPHRITYAIFFKFPLDITLSSIGRFESGFYYPLTLGDPRARELGQGPWTKRIDIRLEKLVDLDIVKASVYLDVLNLFNSENVQAYDNSNTGQLIFERTGNPTGYDATSATPQYTGRPVLPDGTPIYDIARQVYVGINVNF